MENYEPGFWQTIIGKALRWLAFVPIGIILTIAIEVLTILGTIWLFRGDLRLFIIIGILFGALFTAIPLIMYTFYGAIYLSTVIICPTPKVGSIIFGTIYYLLTLPLLIGMFINPGEMGAVIPSALLQLAFLATAGVGLHSIYNEH